MTPEFNKRALRYLNLIIVAAERGLAASSTTNPLDELKHVKHLAGSLLEEIRFQDSSVDTDTEYVSDTFTETDLRRIAVLVGHAQQELADSGISVPAWVELDLQAIRDLAAKKFSVNPDDSPAVFHRIVVTDKFDSRRVIYDQFDRDVDLLWKNLHDHLYRTHSISYREAFGELDRLVPTQEMCLRVCQFANLTVKYYRAELSGKPTNMWGE